MDVNGTRKAGLIPPLQCWDVFSSYLNKMNQQGSRHCDLQQLQVFQEKYAWNVDMTALLSNDYQALVLTDKSVHIHWVNPGFQSMTGYSLKEVKNKSPKMLQGTRTSDVSRAYIRERLFSQHAFTTEVINYRKNGEEYMCRVNIHPLLNSDDRLSHFLALETKI